MIEESANLLNWSFRIISTISENCKYFCSLAMYFVLSLTMKWYLFTFSFQAKITKLFWKREKQHETIMKRNSLKQLRYTCFHWWNPRIYDTNAKMTTSLMNPTFDRHQKLFKNELLYNCYDKVFEPRELQKRTKSSTNIILF